MAELVQKAAQFMTGKSSETIAEALAGGKRPALLNLLKQIALRFNVSVSRKVLAHSKAQSILAIRIISGAGINNAFAGHFNKVARYHFGILKLERRYGEKVVHAEYRSRLGAMKALKRLESPT